MGSCVSISKGVVATAPRKSSIQSIAAHPSKSSEELPEEIVRILTSQVEENDEADHLALEDAECSQRLSDIAERLFLQDLKLETKATVEIGYEKPIEVESEQARRRLQKHRASIAAQGAIGAEMRGDSFIGPNQDDREPSPTAQSDAPERFLKRQKSLDVESSSKFLRGVPSINPSLEETYSERVHGKTADDEAVGETTASSNNVFYQRVFITGESGDFDVSEIRDFAMSIIHALRTRQFYMRLARQNFSSMVAKTVSQAIGKPPKQVSFPEFCDPMTKPQFPPDEKRWVVQTKQGFVTVIDEETNEEVFLPFVNRDRFIANRNLLYALVADGPLKSFCYRRLSYLKNKFWMHRLLNEGSELEMMKSLSRACRRDFYNVRKVDTHIHAAACMSQKHLLGFMQEKAKKEPDRVVLKKDGNKMTLMEVFKGLELNPSYLNVDSLDVHADRKTFHRFDRFNNLYSPMGASELREIFLKTNNDTNGDYFAEIISQVEQSLLDRKYHLAELRVSIYGKSYDEWENLAHWFCSHKLQSTHIRWLIQVPRLYDVYKAKSVVDTFEQLLDNVFRPVMEATVRPHKHKDMSLFLRHVVGFDSVDDESKYETGFLKKTSPTPDEWRRDTNPSYTYYLFYMFSNIARINHLRLSRGQNTFTLRPHCGEAGHHDHLLTAFMLADNISHGLVLKKVPVLQYFYYLAQIGICMSPLSNNHLFLEYHKSPFPDYFARGLKVCLSTDDPLQFHFTMEPLLEEYAVAAQVWKLSVCDMCELARTSVQVSGFSHEEKQKWLGNSYREDGAKGNDIHKTNVPDIRVAFRDETLAEELRMLSDAFPKQPPDGLADPVVEENANLPSAGANGTSQPLLPQ